MKTVIKFLGGLLLVLSVMTIKAQSNYEYIPLVKPGTQVWHDDMSQEYCRWLYETIITDEDTVIDGKTYNKLYRYSDTANEYVRDEPRYRYLMYML